MTVTQNEVNTAVVRLFFYIVDTSGDTSGEDVLRDEFVSKYPSINKLIITEMQNNNMFEMRSVDVENIFAKIILRFEFCNS